MSEHLDRSYKDWGKAFRSRPGSDDWKARCSCGWESKIYYHGRSEAAKGWARHVGRDIPETDRALVAQRHERDTTQ